MVSHSLVVVAVLVRPRDPGLLVQYGPPHGLVAGSPLRRGLDDVADAALDQVVEGHDNRPERDLHGADGDEAPADPRGPVGVGHDPGVLVLAPGGDADDEDDAEEDGGDADPGDLPEEGGLAAEHQLEVLAHVLETVDPHQTHDLKSEKNA